MDRKAVVAVAAGLIAGDRLNCRQFNLSVRQEALNRRHFNLSLQFRRSDVYGTTSMRWTTCAGLDVVTSASRRVMSTRDGSPA